MSIVENHNVGTNGVRPPSARNVFKPRRRKYTTEEKAFMGTLLPLEKLPKQLVATSETRTLPPQFVRGWVVLSDNQDWLRGARERGIWYEWTDHSGKPAGFNPVTTFGIYAETVITDLGLDTLLPYRDYIYHVYDHTPEDEKRVRTTLVLGLYDNYVSRSDRPSKETIDKIAQAFNLKGVPGWYPTTGGLRWQYC